MTCMSRPPKFCRNIYIFYTTQIGQIIKIIVLLWTEDWLLNQQRTEAYDLRPFF